MNTEKIEIITNSKWKKNLKHDYFKSDTDTLVIMLPGHGYTLSKPIFYYLTGLYFKLKYDVLKINYGFQFSQEDIEFEDISTLIKEVIDVLSKINIESYNRIIVIGKSLGTMLVEDVVSKIESKDVKKIFITPTDFTLPKIIEGEALIIYGSKDEKLNEINKRKILNSSSQVMVVEDANHALETNEIIDDIEILYKLIDCIGNFSKI